jgi:phytanoyl-CoA hydroxylase
MLELKTPRGLAVQVPEHDAEDPSRKFGPDEHAGIADYYRDNGYVIVRGLLPAADCDTIRQLWADEVKPDPGFVYRQATARAERHVFNERGWVMNPILNLQSVNPRRFPKFRRFATENILTASPLARTFRVLLGDEPRIVQSMYFEGNSATWEHQDSYYLDSEQVGAMAAAWIALEDISATAGRFFICPGSHRIRLDDHSLENNIAEHHEEYILSVVAKIRSLGLEIRAPRLERGDVLFWNSLTIHGSLDSQDPEHSRSSITCHAVPRRLRFLQLQTKVMDLKTDVVQGVEVARPKDQSQWRNRLVFGIESHFPRGFYWLKKQAVKAMFRK